MGVGIAVACVPTLAPLFRHRAETAKNMSAKQLVDGHVRLRSLENMSDSTKDISTASQTRTINLDYDNRQFDYKASARHLPSQVHHAVQTGLKLQYANGIGVQREFVVTTSSHGRSFPK
jgi:hypothetical protein